MWEHYSTTATLTAYALCFVAFACLASSRSAWMWLVLALFTVGNLALNLTFFGWLQGVDRMFWSATYEFSCLCVLFALRGHWSVYAMRGLVFLGWCVHCLFIWEYLSVWPLVESLWFYENMERLFLAIGICQVLVGCIDSTLSYAGSRDRRMDDSGGALLAANSVPCDGGALDRETEG